LTSRERCFLTSRDQSGKEITGKETTGDEPQAEVRTEFGQPEIVVEIAAEERDALAEDIARHRDATSQGSYIT